ncbi:MAG: XdhC family protein [Halobacteriaceae archaeon]
MTNSTIDDSNWSIPETEVLERVRDILDSQKQGVLATIIDVEGSAYRRPGAKMIVSEEGEGIGHITAGCLEDEVERLADDVLASGKPRVETYDLRPESEDDVWGLGVGCNGIVDILVEPIDESYQPVIKALNVGNDVGVITIIDAENTTSVGSRGYYDPSEGKFRLDDDFPEDIADDLKQVTENLVEDGRADSFEIDGTTVFVDGIAAPDDLVIVGSGHDIGPIASLGKQAGFQVTVVGFRGANATPDRFPAADNVISTSPAQIRDTVDFDADTYVVVATHNFIDDRIAVKELLESSVPYVGLMGPRERFDEMMDDWESEDTTIPDSELDRLYTPVGLDLGGGSPHQIAISIISEVLAVSNDREPRHLKEREGPIHDRVEIPQDS